MSTKSDALDAIEELRQTLLQQGTTLSKVVAQNANATARVDELEAIVEAFDEPGPDPDPIPDPDPDPDPDPEPDPTDETIFTTGPITDPKIFPNRAWLGGRTFLAKCKFPASAEGGFVKVFGAEFSGEPGRAGMVLGRRNNGDAEAVILAEGGQYVQATFPVPVEEYMLIGWRLRDGAVDLIINDNVIPQSFSGATAVFDLRAAAGAGFWNSQIVGGMPLHASFGSKKVLTDAEIDAWDAAHPAPGATPGNGNGDPDPKPDPDPTPGDDNVGPIEPTNNSRQQVTLSVGTAPRQTIWGVGWGIGSHDSAKAVRPKYEQYATKICEDMGATVVRFLTTESPGFIGAYGPVWNIIKDHGVDTIYSTSYINLHADNNAGAIGVAEGIAAAMDAGMIPELWIASLRNEPDSPHGGEVGTYLEQIMGKQLALRQRLDQLGLTKVLSYGLAWRHPTATSRMQLEWDMHQAAGRIPSVLQGGICHIYDKGPNESDFDKRWLKSGVAILSGETGNMNSPNAIAREMSGINGGGIGISVWHQGLAGSADSNPVDVQQKLIRATGEPNDWYYACAALGRELKRGTVMRLCTSSVAGRMHWKNWSVPHVAICGKRPDNRWLLGVCNYGNNASQFTMTVPELAQRDAVLSGQRITVGGAVSAAKSNMKAGTTRFSLKARETIFLVGG